MAPTGYASQRANIRRVFQGKPPAWLLLWCGWVALGSLVAVRSWKATRLEETGLPIRTPTLRAALSGNGQVAALTTPRHTLQIVQLDSGEVTELAAGADGKPLDGETTDLSLDEAGVHLTFSSHATNWVSDDTNGLSDVFLHDLRTHTTDRCVPPEPDPGLSSSFTPALNPEGSLVAYISYGIAKRDNVQGRNLCIYDVASRKSRRLPDNPDHARGPALGPPSFGPGNALAVSCFSVDLNPDFYRPLRYEVYQAQATLLDPVLTLLSRGLERQAANGNSYQPVLTSSECIFASQASNLVPDDHNRCHDIFTATADAARPLQRLSLTQSGAEANGSSFEPCASRDGRWLAFTSYASNLVAGNVGSFSNVYLLDRRTKSLKRLSQATASSHSPRISMDGRRVLFRTEATTKLPASTYLYDQRKGLQLVSSPRSGS